MNAERQTDVTATNSAANYPTPLAKDSDDDRPGPVTDESGNFWQADSDGNTIITAPDGSMTTFSADGKQISIFLTDDNGTTLKCDAGGTWTFTNINEQSGSWSERDENWILNFNPAVHGSHWDYDSSAQSWTIRESPHPTRPQGIWHSEDGKTTVFEVNGNLFAQSGDRYAMRIAELETGQGKHEWIPTSRDNFTRALILSHDREVELANPQLAALDAATSNALHKLEVFGEVYAKVGYEGLNLVPFVGPLKAVAEAIAGRNMVGEQLSPVERLIGFLPAAGAAIKAVGAVTEAGYAVKAVSATTAAGRAEAIAKGDEVVKEIGHAAHLVHRADQSATSGVMAYHAYKGLANPEQANPEQANPEQAKPLGEGQVNWPFPSPHEPGQPQGSSDGASTAQSPQETAAAPSAPAALAEPVEVDNDGDGVADSTAAAPSAPAALAEPVEVDNDGDGVADGTAAAPSAPAALAEPVEVDNDGDGVADGTAAAPSAPAALAEPVEVDNDGDGVADGTAAAVAVVASAEQQPLQVLTDAEASTPSHQNTSPPGDGVPDGPPAPAAGTDPADSDGAEPASDQPLAAPFGHDPHSGAAVSTFDPAHSVAVPNAPTAAPTFNMEADAAARGVNLEAAANPGPVVLAAYTAQAAGQQPVGEDHAPVMQGTPEPQQPSFEKGGLTPQISHPSDGDAADDYGDATITSNQQVTHSQTLGHDEGSGASAGTFDPAHVQTSGPGPDLGTHLGTTTGDDPPTAAFDPAHNMAAPNLAAGVPGPDIGASAGAFDPAHNMAAPNLAAGVPGSDIGASAGAFDPAHNMAAPNLAAGVPGSDIGASAGAFDPAHNMAAPNLAAGVPGSDIGASAGAFDPAHNMAAPNLAAGVPGSDIGASAGAFDPAHNMAAPNLPTATGPSPHASTFDPAHDQSQNAAQQLSQQMYQQAQHVDQQTQHVHEPAHQQVYDPGGHGE